MVEAEVSGNVMPGGRIPFLSPNTRMGMWFYEIHRHHRTSGLASVF